MLFIERPHTDPYYNIAAEEYFLKNFQEDIFMLWQNQPSIILGKHQNALKEINLDFVKKNNIPVIRRISGGGTVFHDLGNLNFTFIKNGSQGKLVNFENFTTPIILVLKELGVHAKFEGKNDLRINGLKISGNAEHVHKNRVLHHGTLLFSSNLSELNEAIKADESKFHDKAIVSNRSIVTNISDHLNNKISLKEFQNSIQDYMLHNNPSAKFYKINEQDDSWINELVVRKYKTWKWNFGYSPKYNFSQTIHIENKPLKIDIEVQSGEIKTLKLTGEKNLEFLRSKLININHDMDIIRKTLYNYKDQINISQNTIEDVVNGMF